MTRASARFEGIRIAGARTPRVFQKTYGQSTDRNLRTSEYYGCNTFGFDQMERKLSASDIAILKEYATSDKPLSLEIANKVADAVRDWSLNRGATHYCHWFQPQTGATAEKHDAFFSLDKKGHAIERFTGKELIQSEPDASSFPSGGVRATFEARGYTVWDASSPMFLMESDNGLTLCIPSLFISYNGEALDEKTPLLRSLSALNKASVESLKLLGHSDVKHVIATAGPEQEYFIVDEALFNLRPDLMLAGRTLLGRTPPRGQQLEDHYFGSIKPRILAFMAEAEHELYKLGVPCKTRHNEVAPSQCEMAPIFENANVAADHNQLVVEVLRTVARRHRLVTLFHEKPYAGINGSGKHVNWSIADNNGHNLLEPGDNPFDNIRFLYFLAATIKAVNTHAKLLRMSIASAGNDFRLGANEAPPAIISCFLGDTLTEVVTKLTSAGGGLSLSERAKQINLDLARVPVIARDNTDRNRTSPFAFTGNKFEFRAVGASASISPSLTYLNAAVANALNEMNRTLVAISSRPTNDDLLKVIVDTLNEHKKVCFDGNGYADEWHKEAEKRGLPNLRTTPDALKPLTDAAAKTLLTSLGVHNESELQARYNVKLERYIKVRLIELETLFEMVSNEVLPAATLQVTKLANAQQSLKAANTSIPGMDQELKAVVDLTADLLRTKNKLGQFIAECSQLHDEGKLADRIASDGIPLMNEVRKASDELELYVDDNLWSVPKYRELLYLM
jgi:glutamine synthetase